ncbi:MAG: hypothetical protein AB8H79_00170 [Myxococcota bacterium]
MQHSKGVTLAIGCAAAVMGIGLLGGCVTAEPKADPIVAVAPAEPKLGHDEPETPASVASVAPADPLIVAPTDPAPVASTDLAACAREDQAHVFQRDLRALMDDPDRLQGLARVRLEKSDNGGFEGIRFSSVNREELLYKAGVRSGDVVFDVDGHSLTSMPALMTAYHELLATTPNEAKVRLMRRGQLVCLTVHVLAKDGSP